MKKPTLEEVKEYFKDAEIIIGADYNDRVDVKNGIEENLHEFSGSFWIKVKGNLSGSTKLWCKNNGYAKILTYKKPSFRPISMRCTQGQFDAVKGILKENGANVSDISSFKCMEYLINNRLYRPLNITNYTRSACVYEGYEIHETWNEKVFLEACGIEVKEPKEGTFVITK